MELGREDFNIHLLGIFTDNLVFHQFFEVETHLSLVAIMLYLTNTDLILC